MKAVILAAGKGTRMRELTNELPKPMLRVQGKPILEHILGGLLAAGIHEVCIITGWRAEVVEGYFGDGAKWGAHISYARQLVQDGTGKAAEPARAFVGMDDFLLTYGDGVCSVDIAELIKFHHASKGLATLTAVRPSGRFGELSITGDAITSFREKPDSEVGYINGGFFVLNKKIGDYLIGDASVFEADALPKIADAGKLNAFRHDGFWQCMDTQREMEILNKFWNDGKAPWKVW